MIYLDSAAIIKLIRRETGTDELITWLGGHPTAPLVASVLVEVEVPPNCSPTSLDLSSSPS